MCIKKSIWNAKCVVLSLIAVAAFMLSGPVMQAQSTGTIAGVVKDSSGAVVPGAAVTERDTDTGATRAVTTGNDGAYRFDALNVGNYSITVAASGFQTAVQSGLTLAVAQDLASNFTLQVGQATQTVSVTTQGTQVDTTTSSLSSLVNPATISDLPLNGRNYISLTLLQPGVTATSVSASTTATASNLKEGGAGQSFSSNGSPLTANNYLIDGAIMNNGADTTGSSSIGTTLGVDGIQEYRVLTNSFAAEYGQKMGSQTLMVSKAGTNQFHGDVFEYLRNSSLDARNEFDLPPSRQPSGERLPPFRRNQFGGSLGGPIVKDKTFFYAVYEGLRSALGATSTDVTLAPGCQGPAGTVITLAACPQLGAASVTIVPAAVPFEALFPAANLPSNEFGFVYNQLAVEDYAQLRLDETFSAKDSAFFRWTFDNSSEGAPWNYNESHDEAIGRANFLTLGENHIFTSNVLNSARFSFSKNPTGANFYPNALLNSPDLQLAPNHPMGALVIGGVTTLGDDSNAPRIFNQSILQYADDLNWVRGRHSFKFGALYNHYNSHIYAGGYDKDNVIMTNVADFLQGQVAEYTGILPGSNFARTFLYDTMGFYGQDAWRLTPRLTINYGLRYEPLTEVIDAGGLGSALRNPLTDTAFTLGPEFLNPSKSNWGPRFGFAYDVFGNGKTALRGGWGILYDQVGYGSGGLVLGAGVSPPGILQYTISNIPLSSPLPAPPYGTFPVVGPTFQWHMRQPYMMSYNLTLEQQLPGQIALTAAYAGSRGIDLFNFLDANPIVPTGVPTANGTGLCVPGPAGTSQTLTSAEMHGLTSQEDGSAISCYLANSPHNNLNFGSVPYYVSNGDSIYNSLQTNLVKRISHGLQFQTAFTWGKVEDDLSGPVVEPLSMASRRGPESFDVTDILSVNVVYHLPDFTGSKGFVSKFTNGWWISGIVSAQSGSPFGIYTSGFPSRDAEDQTYSVITDSPDLVKGRDNANMTHGVTAGCGSFKAGTPLHTKSLWYDPCAFSTQPAGYVGTAPRNFLRGPGYDDFDTSVVKDTGARFLGEGGQVEFRAEFFNIPNHVNLSLPGTQAMSGNCPNGGLTGCSAAQQGPLGSAGLITSANGTPRQIQFALKAIF